MHVLAQDRQKSDFVSIVAGRNLGDCRHAVHIFGTVFEALSDECLGCRSYALSEELWVPRNLDLGLFAKMIENDPGTKLVQIGFKTSPRCVFIAKFEFFALNYPQKLFSTIFEIFYF